MERNPRSNKNKRQRDDDDSQFFTNKRLKTNLNERVWRPMNQVIPGDDLVSATKIKNYLLDDPIIDWLDVCRERKNVESCRSNPSILCEMGLKFEEEVVKFLREKYPGSVKKVIDKREDIRVENIRLTVECMESGIPIIEQALLHNGNNNTFGVADLLIRSDWVNRLFKKRVLTDEEANTGSPILESDYHYIVVDIKWTTMLLCSNGRLIRNCNRFPAYKGQLTIYNSALGQLQGYTPAKAYILAKGWKYEEKGKKYQCYDCFERLGEINFMNFDNRYIGETVKAIQWIRDVRMNGKEWTHNPPSVPELYPNMNNKYDGGYHQMKKKIAEELNELTQIWMVGIKNRRGAHDRGIFSIKDPGCSSKTLGINGEQTAEIVDKIIEINRSNKSIILPKKIKDNSFNWRSKTSSDFFVDFETINMCFYNREINLRNSQNIGDLIFLIGVGYEEDNRWVYRSFSIENCTVDEERRIIDEFTNFIKQKAKRMPKLFHWTNAEVSMFNRANMRHNNRWGMWNENICWIDYFKIFQKERIVINGVYKFSLKAVANAMCNHGLIDTRWEEGVTDGLDAMLKAINYFKNSVPKERYDQIVKYNEVDCKVIWEIVNYLRTNH